MGTTHLAGGGGQGVGGGGLHTMFFGAVGGHNYGV